MSRFSSLLHVLLVLGLACTVRSPAAEMEIVRNGEPVATIVVHPSQASSNAPRSRGVQPGDRQAADVLTEWVQKEVLALSTVHCPPLRSLGLQQRSNLMGRIALFASFLALIPVANGAATDLAQLPDLIKALKSDDAGTKDDALYHLRDLGLDAAPALPEIIRALDDPDKGVRKRAADALGAIGPEAAPAIPRLVALLGEGEILRVGTDMGGSFDLCIHAAMALGHMGPGAVGPLVRALEHRNPVVRYHATWPLGDLGPEAKAAVPGLVKLFRDREEMVRMSAVRAVFKIGADANAVVPAVLGRLDDSHRGTRIAAVDALGALRPLTPEAMDGLIRALRDKEGQVQWHAIRALGGLGADAAPAVPALCEMLKSRQSYVYPDYHPYFCLPVAAPAAESLGRIGPAAASAMPSLLAAVRDTEFSYIQYTFPEKTGEVRTAAVKAAAQIDPNSDELLRLLEQSLGNFDDLDGGAIFALAQIGPKAESLVPLLVDRMSQAEGRERLLLACAVIHIQPSHRRAVDTLCRTVTADTSLSDDGWELFRSAVKLAGPEARHLIPALAEMLVGDKGDPVNAARTLGQFGPAARIAVPALIDRLADTDDLCRREAIEALKQITEGKPALLWRALRHHGPEVRCGVTEILGPSPQSVELLVYGLLDDPSARVRLAAVTALARLGKPAKEAIPYIRPLLADERPTIRAAAKETIRQLEP